MKSSNSVLLIEFDAVIATAIKKFLMEYGYEVTVASDAASAIRLLQIKGIDLILCDLNSLENAKLKIAKHISDADMLRSVVLMLRNNEDVNVCKQLNMNVVKYLTIPFMPNDLLEAVRACFCAPPNGNIISVGNMTFNRRKYQLQTAVGSVELTKNEAVILQNLIDHMGAVVRREVLYAQIDTYGLCNSNRTVDVHVFALRKKLNRIDSNLEILTKRGVGYILRIGLT